MVYFGTSGFSYSDWVGSFYPSGMPRREWLVYYANEFNACEVNSTCYAIPKPSSLKAMAEKTGEGFLFSIKANQEMIHQREDNASIFRAFCQVLAPIISAGKLGCILAQFPYSPSELSEWLPKIQKLDKITEKTFVFANNHWRGQAVSTIRQLQMMLD